MNIAFTVHNENISTRIARKSGNGRNSTDSTIWVPPPFNLCAENRAAKLTNIDANSVRLFTKRYFPLIQRFLHKILQIFHIYTNHFFRIQFDSRDWATLSHFNIERLSKPFILIAPDSLNETLHLVRMQRKPLALLRELHRCYTSREAGGKGDGESPEINTNKLSFDIQWCFFAIVVHFPLDIRLLQWSYQYWVEISDFGHNIRL